MFSLKNKIKASLVSIVIKQIHTNATKIMEKKAFVNGININYVRAGKKDGRGILLMPGALGSAYTDFQPQIDNLPQLLPDFTIIAWDPPGYGKSIPPQRHFTIDFFQKDAEEAINLMKKIGFDKFSVLGWSDGGITGMVIAAQYSDLIEKLVVWGSNSYIVEKELRIYESIRDVRNWSPKMRKPMEDMYGAENFAKLWSNWVDIFVKIYHEKGGEICSKDLHKIKCPTFILHGSKDPMIAEEHTDHLQKHIANTEFFEFKDGKHNIHLRYADEFNKLVASFLQK